VLGVDSRHVRIVDDQRLINIYIYIYIYNIIYIYE
jgi:hypothetical protein